MGKLNHHPFLTHFSHPHPLELSNLDLPNTQSSSCSACCLPHSTGYIYTCKTCPNFSLHLPCSQMPSSITHPSHPYHPLSLSPVSSYPGGKFSCDACKIHSGGFSYHCSACSFDLHIKCAVKPLVANHHLHPHPLELTFGPPYGEGTGFSCDVCRHVGTSHWLYRCGSCEFDVHLDCPYTPPRPAPGQSQSPLIHQQSLPAQPLKHQQSMPVTKFKNTIHIISDKWRKYKLETRKNPLAHQQSMPAMGVQPQMQYSNSNNYYSQQQQGQAPFLQHSGSTGMMQNQQQPVQSWQSPAPAPGQMYNTQPPQAAAAANQSMGNMMMQAAMQSFVEGAAQQVGQTFVQEMVMMNEDNNNNGGTGADQGDTGN